MSSSAITKNHRKKAMLPPQTSWYYKRFKCPPTARAWRAQFGNLGGDSGANFYFSAGPSAYIAIYRSIADPVVNITSATLVVTGERTVVATAPTGDFDG